MHGHVVEGTGPESVLSSEDTLVIDPTTNRSAVLVWRGAYRDQESSGSKIAQKLPETPDTPDGVPT
jgi:hypothetical protein